MRHRLRRWARGSVALLWTLACWMAVLASLAIGAVWPRFRRRGQRWVMLRWARVLLRILGARVEIRGEPMAGGGLLVTNHLSYLDVLVIASVVPARFVAKAEIRGWPLIGWLCRSVDILFVDRGSKRHAARVAEEMAAALAHGDTVVLFPEGTSTHGHTVTPFRAALLEPAAALALPVHYGCLGYQTPAAAPPAFMSLCWWGDMEFMPHLTEVLALPQWSATLCFGNPPITSRDRKELASRLRAAIEEIFEPVVAFEPISSQQPYPSNGDAAQRAPCSPTV